MRTFFALLVLSSLAFAETEGLQGQATDEFKPRYDRTRNFRVGRAGAKAYAAFEFAPLGGAGMGVACAGTIPTDVRGNVPTFTRASQATCLKSNSLTSGIAPGDMVTLSNNQPRITYGLVGANAILGFLAERSTVQDCLQTEVFENAAWTSTATVTVNGAPINTPLNTGNGDLLTDASAVALQGSCQTISTTSATVQVASVFVVGGTATAAQVTMTGTGSATGDCSTSVTGLSTTTWTRIQCVSPAAYAGTLTAVTVCVNVGSVVADTGTLGVFGFNHEVNHDFATSYVSATTVAVTRAVDSSLLFNLMPAGVRSAGSSAMTFIPGWTKIGAFTHQVSLLVFDANGQPLETPNGTDIRMFDGVTEPLRATTYTAATASRLYSFWSGGSMTVSDTAGTTSGAFDGTMGATNQIEICSRNGGASPGDGVCKLVCVDPDPNRCR